MMEGVYQRNEVEKDEKDVEHQTRMGVIPVTPLRYEGEGPDGKTKPCDQNERNQDEEYRLEAQGHIIPGSAQDEERGQARCQEGQEEPRNGEMVGFPEFTCHF